MKTNRFAFLWLGLSLLTAKTAATDWPMFGRDQTRNAVSPEKNPPVSWMVEVDPQGQPLLGRGQNVKWIARLGDLSFGGPVVANGYVWIGTNNEQPRDPAVKEDAAVLMCFRESDGEFVWQYGCNAVGYEISPRLVQRSLEAVRQGKLEHLVRIEERDLFTADLGQADVVTLYLPGLLLEKLLPQFRQLKAGARIVSHEFVIPGQQPERTVRMTSTEDKTEHAIHLWTTPLKGTP
jgi:hypothetical protein